MVKISDMMSKKLSTDVVEKAVDKVEETVDSIPDWVKTAGLVAVCGLCVIGLKNLGAVRTTAPIVVKVVIKNG